MAPVPPGAGDRPGNDDAEPAHHDEVNPSRRDGERRASLWLPGHGRATPPGPPAEPAPDRTDSVRRAEADPERYARERATVLQNQLPENTRGRVTMAVGVGVDAAERTRVVVATSEPHGYLRPGVILDPGEELSTDDGHAEAAVLSYMTDRAITPTHLGSGRPICDVCADSIDRVGAIAATGYKHDGPTRTWGARNLARRAIAFAARRAGPADPPPSSQPTEGNPDQCAPDWTPSTRLSPAGWLERRRSDNAKRR